MSKRQLLEWLNQDLDESQLKLVLDTALRGLNYGRVVDDIEASTEEMILARERLNAILYPVEEGVVRVANPGGIVIFYVNPDDYIVECANMYCKDPAKYAAFIPVKSRNTITGTHDGQLPLCMTCAQAYHIANIANRHGHSPSELRVRGVNDADS